MFNVKFTPRGAKEFKKISPEWQDRLSRKLKYFANQEDPIKLSKSLTNLLPATHRFRVGDYRVAFFIEKDTIYVDRIGHRREVYYLEIEQDN